MAEEELIEGKKEEEPKKKVIKKAAEPKEVEVGVEPIKSIKPVEQKRIAPTFTVDNKSGDSGGDSSNSSNGNNSNSSNASNKPINSNSSNSSSNSNNSNNSSNQAVSLTEADLTKLRDYIALFDEREKERERKLEQRQEEEQIQSKINVLQQEHKWLNFRQGKAPREVLESYLQDNGLDVRGTQIELGKLYDIVNRKIEGIEANKKQQVVRQSKETKIKKLYKEPISETEKLKREINKDY